METKKVHQKLMDEFNNRLEKIELLLTTSKAVLNIGEVSALTGLSKSTIYKFTCLGKMPHYKQAKHLYFDRLEVEAWLKEHRGFNASELQEQASSFIINRKGGEES